MTDYMSTYTSGYKLRITTPITKGTIINLCRRLKEEFTTEYGGHWQFQPEPISEGGIIFILDKGYKSMRIYLDDWPHVPDNVMKKWPKEANDIIESDDGKPIKEISTFLKSFHGADPWTLDELKIFERCLSEIGLVRKGRYPAKKSLTHM